MEGYHGSGGGLGAWTQIPHQLHQEVTGRAAGTLPENAAGTLPENASEVLRNCAEGGVAGWYR